jgi:hypothetical protein
MEVIMENKVGIYNAMYVDGRLGRGFNKIIEDIESFNYKKVYFFDEFEGILSISQTLEEFNNFKKFLKNKNAVFYHICGAEFQDLHKDENKYGKLHDDNFKFLGWPTFLLHFSYYALEHLKNNHNIDNQHNYDYEYLFLSYNNKKSYHRCLLIDLMCKNDILGSGVFSWRMGDEFLSNDYIFKYWEEKKIEIDLNSNIQMDEWNPDIFKTKEFVTVVPETRSDFIFITEKTFKPILMEKPFLIFGSQNQNLILKKYDFELYDEIFDYSFDNHFDLDVRAQGLIDNLKSIKNQNLKILHKKIKDKIKRNKKRAIDIINDDPYIPVELISLYKNNNNEFKKAIDNNIIPDWFNKIMKNK